MRNKYTVCQSFVYSLLLVAAIFLPGAVLAQTQSERSVNNEYRAIIMQYLNKDVAERQAAMSKRAEALVLELPNDRKLYDESKIEIEATIEHATLPDGTTEENYVLTIGYYNRNVEGKTDDYGDGQYLLEQSNSTSALAMLAQKLLAEYNSDLFAAGKQVNIRITGGTDAKQISHLNYGGEYGEFRYCPTLFNSENVRVSIDTTSGINTNAQLAYLRCQGLSRFLQQQVPQLQNTENTYEYITYCYGETGTQYRRSRIEFVVHGAFDEMISTMNEKLINDEFIEYNIPQATPNSNTNTFALIIANEQYEAPLPNCSYAWRDGAIVREYCIKTLGIPERHVKVLNNASIAQIERKGIKWLKDIMTAVKGDANIIVYYAGHGISDIDHHQYLIPCGMNIKGIRSWQGKGEIDISSPMSKRDIKALIAQCLPLDTLCTWFNRVPVKNVTMIIDAGFNGNQRNGETMININRSLEKPRGMRLRNDIVIFCAAAEEKTAFAFEQQHHGFFTYFIMKELKRTKGDISYFDLFNNVEKAMSYESSLQGKLQEPTMIVGGKLKEAWGTLRFKP